MDLIKIHERAKEAGISIDIGFEPKFGEYVTIAGRTITDNYCDMKAYSRRIDIDEIRYHMSRGDDAIELAMDEIIENLRPTLDWEKAEGHLRFMMDLYRGIGWTGMFGLQLGLRPLEDRLLSGERTQELYDEIMALH